MFFNFETCVHEILNECINNFDNNLVSCMLFVDFKKAFDMVDHKLLLHKLLSYGFGNEAYNLLKNYFINRGQITKIGSVNSTFDELNLGVPQGSVLGPLLFSIFINDLPIQFMKSAVKLFADDTTIVINGFDLEIVLNQLKLDIKILDEWCKHNKLYVNWSKTFIMFYSNKRIAWPSCFEYQHAKIDVVSTFKLLGILLDNKLTFINHVNSISSSINKKLYSIKKLFYLSFDVKLQFFKCFILPYFDYCISLSIYFHKTAIRKLCKIYYICLFKLFKLKFYNQTTTDINNSLKCFGLFSFHTRVVYRITSFLYHIVFSINSPTILKSKLKIITEQNHEYNVRVKNVGKFEVIRSRTKVGDLKFNFIFSKYLNSISFFLLEKETDFKKFKSFLNLNISNFVASFIKLLPKFNVDLNSFFFNN